MHTTTERGAGSARPAADRRVQEAVAEELDWTPGVDAARIGVAVHDGVATLTGEPASFAEAIAARKAALRVRGVRAVADDLRVRSGREGSRSDAEVAGVVAAALQASAEVPDGAVQATVQDGVVTLTGAVDRHDQREAARRAVERLAGVRSVAVGIELTARTAAPDTADRIRRALARNAVLDADRIEVTADGTEVVLSGTVRSAAERQQAVLAAWASPHVTVVHDRLAIAP